MPFIDKDSIKKKRGEIRAALPGFKFSVRNMDYRGVQIVIQEGPVDFDLGDSDYGSVPNFYVRLSIGEWDRPYQIKGANK